MFKNKLIDILKFTAPGLARALGGPMAGVAVELLTEKLIGSKKSDMNSNLSDLEKFFQKNRFNDFDFFDLENKWQKILLDAQLKHHEMDVLDRRSARARAVEQRDDTPKYLAAVIVFGYFIIVLFVFFLETPKDKSGEFALLLGALSTMTGGVINYYFGSSIGSKSKTNLLADK